ncbi:MAG: TetR/AcrR family transcriptional regulator [Pseudomonas sp.]|uniref:acrylate utilization transcriptional regulator AcuR n=1 Tax=Pseudomonas abieticivorans TaxID=2931382 RepID=UPI0020BEB7CE|nr:TetR/AcrR family transcriptional regulator [Pseudomonas sp. PIA16]MDE1167951.1 TetR/AcrR family transcriptional regulator [Pseudomonas sp.]
MTTQTPTPRKPGRPPKVPREQYDTRELLVRCGTEILTEQGFSATGIDMILKRVGVPKGSFYHYFASKDAYGRALLDNYADYFARKLDRWLLDESMSPLERVLAFSEDAQVGMAKYEFKRGCLVGNLGQEITVLPEGYREAIEAVFLSWQQRLSTCLKAAQTAGDIPKGANCDELAAFFWIGWEGAVLRARLLRNAQPMRTFVSGFLKTAFFSC